MGEVLYEGIVEQRLRANLAIRVLRKEPIRLAREGEVLVIKAKLKVWVQEQSSRDIWSLWKDLPTVNVEQTDFDISVSFYTSVSLQEDWQLLTQSTGSFQWTRKPKLGIALMRISIARLLEPELKHQIHLVSMKIDRFVREEIELRKWAEAAWVHLLSPQKLHDNLWLQLISSPTSIQIKETLWLDDRIRFPLRIPSIPKIFLKLASPQRPTFFLEDLELIKDISQTEKTSIHFLPSLEAMQSILLGSNISLGGLGTLRIGTASLEVKADMLEANIQAELFLGRKLLPEKLALGLMISGKPILGTHSQWVSVSDISCRIQSNHIALKAVDKFMHRRINRLIKEGLNTWFAELQQTTLTELKVKLQETDLHTHAQLQGELLSHEAEKLSPSGESWRLAIQIKANMYIRLRNLVFSLSVLSLLEWLMI